MVKKSEKRTLIELCDALLQHLFKYPTDGLSLPFIHVNMSCGRLDRIVEYLHGFSDNIAECTFVSVWDDGILINTPAVYMKKTGRVITESVGIEGLDILKSEYIVLEGRVINICSECHEYVIVGEKCRNEHCDSNKGGEPDVDNNKG